MKQSAYHKLSEATVAEIRKAFADLDIKTFTQKAQNEENGTFKVVASKQTPDRSGEELKLDGWQLKNFQKNPVLLWAHDYRSMPIGAVTKIAVEGKELIAEGYFAPAEVNPVGQQVRRAYDAGIINAVSVGFMPLEYDKDFKILAQELVELSFVPVPMHPEALRKEGWSEKDISDLQAILKTEDTEQGDAGDEEEPDPTDETPTEPNPDTTEPTETPNTETTETPEATETEPKGLTRDEVGAILDAKLQPIYDKLTAIEGKGHEAIRDRGDTKGRDPEPEGSDGSLPDDAAKAIKRTAQEIDKAAESIIRHVKSVLNDRSAK